MQQANNLSDVFFLLSMDKVMNGNKVRCSTSLPISSLPHRHFFLLHQLLNTLETSFWTLSTL
jgi:hypothetical protein